MHCLFLASSFSFAPSLPCVPGAVLHPSHPTTLIDFGQALGDAWEGELRSAAAMCHCTCHGWATHWDIPSRSVSREGELRSAAAMCCCTCHGWATHWDIPSHSISRPPWLGDRACPGGSAAWLRAALRHDSQKSVASHMLLPHLLTWVRACSSPAQRTGTGVTIYPLPPPSALAPISQAGDAVSQNHRMFEVGRDLCGSSSPTL